MAIALGFPQMGLAKSATVVRISPDETLLDPNATAEIEVWVDGVEDLWGFEIAIAFDADLIQIVDANPATAGVQVVPGDFLESPGQHAMVAANDADNEAGTINFGISQFQDNQDPNLPTAKTGSGVLLRFTILSEDVLDVTELTISSVVLTDRNGMEISCTSENGLVLIDGKKSTEVFIPLFIH